MRKILLVGFSLLALALAGFAQEAAPVAPGNPGSNPVALNININGASDPTDLSMALQLMALMTLIVWAGIRAGLKPLALLQSQVDQELELHHRELAPHRVVVKLDADERGDVQVIVELVVL